MATFYTVSRLSSNTAMTPHGTAYDLTCGQSSYSAVAGIASYAVISGNAAG